MPMPGTTRTTQATPIAARIRCMAAYCDTLRLSLGDSGQALRYSLRCAHATRVVGHILWPSSRTMPEASRNRMVERGPDNVWDRQTQSSPYDQERWIAAAWGSALTITAPRTLGSRPRGAARSP